MSSTEPGKRSFFSSILTYKLSFRNPSDAAVVHLFVRHRGIRKG